MANKRIYKSKLKHWNMKPALDSGQKKEYSYRVLDAEACKSHGAAPSTDLLKFAIAAFDGEQFVHIAGWFSSEKSAQDCLRKFPHHVKKNKKKFVREKIGLNTTKG